MHCISYPLGWYRQTLEPPPDELAQAAGEG